MRIGPVDFNQPSTWRGLIGILGISGFSFSPALNEQIALLAATLIALIELFRDEYAKKKPTTTAPAPSAEPLEPITLISPGFNPAAHGERATDELRPVPPHDSSFPSAGFGDR